MSQFLDAVRTQQSSVANLLAATPTTQQNPGYQGFAYSPPWIYPPANFESRDLVGTLATPALGAGNQVVLAYTVPFGFDGVLRRLSHNYTGGNLTDGSGGIVWQLLIDGRAVAGYDHMIVQFGSTANPRPIDGIRIYQNQLVQYMVNVVGGGGFIPAGGSFISCSFSGWIYPRMSA